MPKVLFVGGGSVGHTAPAVAIAKALMSLRQDTTVHFVCIDREDEKEFLKQEGMTYSILHAPKRSLLFLWKFWKALREAKTILEQATPELIVSTGGYVSVPLCYSAHKKNIRIILHEADAVGGKANKLLSKWASVITTGFPLEESNQKYHYTGNPIRAEVTTGSKEQGYALTGFDSTKPVLLVMGGSQGSQTINECVLAHIEDLLAECNIVHITGRGKLKQITKPGYKAYEFVTTELPHLYAIADLAISRAGAGSIAELLANSIPAIFVPLPGLAQDHQTKNAMNIAAQELGILLEQHDINDHLLDAIETLLPGSVKREEIEEKLKHNSKNDAALQIGQIVSQSLDHSSKDA